MSEQSIDTAREALDMAVYEWVAALGVDPDDFDYSSLNTELDDIEEILRGDV